MNALGLILLGVAIGAGMFGAYAYGWTVGYWDGYRDGTCNAGRDAVPSRRRNFLPTTGATKHE